MDEDDPPPGVGCTNGAESSLPCSIAVADMVVDAVADGWLGQGSVGQCREAGGERTERNAESNRKA